MDVRSQSSSAYPFLEVVICRWNSVDRSICQIYFQYGSNITIKLFGHDSPIFAPDNGCSFLATSSVGYFSSSVPSSQ